MSDIKPKWLIVEDSFPDDLAPLLDSLNKAGIEYIPVHSTIYFDTDKVQALLGRWKSSQCIIYYGPLNLGKRLIHWSDWIPGVYYDVPKYECTAYYAHLGEFLLNSNYCMLPWGDMIRQKEFLYEKLGIDRTIFVRPSRGDKIFTGQIIYKENYEETINRLNTTDFSDEEIIVVAEPQNIEGEWRFVIAEERVIAGSRYKLNNIVGSHPSYPVEAAGLAQAIAQIYHPESVFVIDIGRTKSGEYKLMEVGCFSCAGLYKCNTDDIVREVSRVALKEWKDVYEI